MSKKKIRKRRRDPNQHKHQERAAPRWLLDFAPSGCNTHTHTHDHRNAQSIMNDVETKRTQDHKEIQDEKNRVKVLGRNKTKKKTKRNRMHRWGSEKTTERNLKQQKSVAHSFSVVERRRQTKLNKLLATDRESKQLFCGREVAWGIHGRIRTRSDYL